MKPKYFKRNVFAGLLFQWGNVFGMPPDLGDNDVSRAASSVPVEATTHAHGPDVNHRYIWKAPSDHLDTKLSYLHKAGFCWDLLLEISKYYDVINDENVTYLVTLADDAPSIDDLFSAARDVPVEKLALIAGAGFAPGARAAVLKEAHLIDAHSISWYTKVLQNVTYSKDVGEILKAAKSVSPERVDMVLNAKFSQKLMVRALTDGRIKEENAALYACLLKDVEDVEDLLVLCNRLTPERLALIASGHFAPMIRIQVMAHSRIHVGNICSFSKLLKWVIEPYVVKHILDATWFASDDKLAFVSDAGFAAVARSHALCAEQITAQNVHHYAALLEGVDYPGELLKAAHGVCDERVAFIAEAGFDPESRSYALRTPQITAQNVHHYVALYKGVWERDKLLKASQGVCDERVAFIAEAGFDPGSRSYALPAPQITPENAGHYARLLKGVYDCVALLKAAQGVCDEKLAFIADAGFRPGTRALALGVPQMTAQNVAHIVTLCKGREYPNDLFEALEGVSDERIAFIAEADFECDTRKHLLRAQQITAQNVHLYASLLKGAHLCEQHLKAAQDVCDERLAFIASAGFDQSSRPCALQALQITKENVGHYARLLKGAWDEDALLLAAKDVSDERLAMIAEADFDRDSRVKALQALQIKKENAGHYARLLKGIWNKNALLLAAKDVSDERLAMIAEADFDRDSRIKALQALQIKKENAKSYARLLNGVWNKDALFSAAKDVSDDRLALIASAGFAEMFRSKALEAGHVTAQNVGSYVRLVEGWLILENPFVEAMGVEDAQLERIAWVGLDPTGRLAELRRVKNLDKAALG